MTEPKQPTEPGASKPSADLNPTDETPHGIPKGAHEHEPTAQPTSDRHATETAVHKAGQS